MSVKCFEPIHAIPTFKSGMSELRRHLTRVLGGVGHLIVPTREPNVT